MKRCVVSLKEGAIPSSAIPILIDPSAHGVSFGIPSEVEVGLEYLALDSSVASHFAVFSYVDGNRAYYESVDITVVIVDDGDDSLESQIHAIQLAIINVNNELNALKGLVIGSLAASVASAGISLGTLLVSMSQVKAAADGLNSIPTSASGPH